MLGRCVSVDELGKEVCEPCRGGDVNWHVNPGSTQRTPQSDSNRIVDRNLELRLELVGNKCTGEVRAEDDDGVRSSDSNLADQASYG